MNTSAIKRIIETINTYIGKDFDKFDGVYLNKNILDLLCKDLKEAIHCGECTNNIKEKNNE